MAAVDVGSRCTCNNPFDGVRHTCVACGRLAGSGHGIIDGDVDGLDETGASVFLPRLIAGFISGVLTGVFAIGT